MMHGPINIKNNYVTQVYETLTNYYKGRKAC